MKAKYLVALVVISVAGLLTYSLFLRGYDYQASDKGGRWYIAITYPINQTMKEGSGSIGLSSYALTFALSFLSGGKINETSIIVGPLGIIPQGNVTLLIELSNETSIQVFTQNSTVRIQGKDQNGLYAATDRLMLALAGEYALGLDETKNYLLLVDPRQGKKVGLQWLGGLPISKVREVRIYFHGKEVDLRELLLGPYWP